MNLVIVTYDYPFGTGEPFLETEIKYASASFDRVYIISTSQNTEQTREVPLNVSVVKCSRRYHSLRCYLYAITKLFSRENLEEVRDTKKLRHKPGMLSSITGRLKAWSIEKRLHLAFKELALNKDDAVAYSYWLAQGAYAVAKHSDMWRLCVSRAHGYEVRDAEGYLPFRRTTDSRLDKIFFISEHTAKEYAAITAPLGEIKNRAKNEIARLGVENSLIIFDEQNGQPEGFTVVSCSAVYPLKRLDLIVSMLEEYSACTPVHWVHFGDGSGKDEIQTLCREKLANRENVTYEFAGQKSNRDVLSYYRTHRVDLFVNSSDSEGIPVSMMEAMSFGIACMARAVGGNPEIVVDGVSGYLLAAEPDASRMAELLEGIVGKTVPQPTSESVKAWWKENYCAEKNYKAFYKQLSSYSAD